jgi:hypothetical protein
MTSARRPFALCRAYAALSAGASTSTATVVADSLDSRSTAAARLTAATTSCPLDGIDPS